LNNNNNKQDFGFVCIGIGATLIANVYLSVSVSKARKKYGIQYPKLYADVSDIDEKGKCKTQKDVEKFNCVQRGHQNTLETLAVVQLLGVLNGLAFPRFSATCLGLYAVGRILYGRGYAANGPKGRFTGAILSHLGDLPLMISTFYLGFKLIQGGL
jgi:glutathione S-transferase